MVKTLPSNAGGVGLLPGWGAKIPHALWPKKQNIKQKQYCNKFSRDFKMVYIQKKFFLMATILKPQCHFFCKALCELSAHYAPIRFWTYFYCCSITKSCLTRCNSMDCSMPEYLLCIIIIPLSVDFRQRLKIFIASGGLFALMIFSSLDLMWPP